MNLVIAQTNIQLFNQLSQVGYSSKEIDSTFRCYELVKNLFNDDFRGSGKTFISHLIGTSSILASFKSPIAIVNAGLLHAAYSDGQFDGETVGISDRKRDYLKKIVGEETESYIAEYTNFPWRQAGFINQVLNKVDYLNSMEKSLVLMRLANELEEHWDFGILYCDNVEERLEFVEIYGNCLVDLAQALGYSVLANELNQIFKAVKMTTIPKNLRSQPNPRYSSFSLNNRTNVRSSVLESQTNKCLEDNENRRKYSKSQQLSKSSLFTKEEIEKSIVDRFESQVALYPQKIAVKTIKNEFTYESLNKLANRLARLILQQSSPETTVVPILFEHDALMVIAILAILKAGKCWVPLTVAYPQKRLKIILNELKASLLITNEKNFTIAQSLISNQEQIINIDRLNDEFSDNNLNLSIPSDTLACVLYTSGSTGKPKGVIHNHRNLLHLIQRGTNTLQINSSDRFSLLPSYSHMAGTNDMLRALLNGAMLLPYNVQERGLKDLATWLIEEKITIYHSVPTLFRHFINSLEENQKFPHLRIIHLGGETLSSQDVELFKQHFSQDCLLLNNLGCTELSSYRQYQFFSDMKLPNNIIPVGYATEDIEVLLVDENDQKIEDNSTGEIILKSPYLALGYWQDNEQTQAVFFCDQESGDHRCYRTGDIGYFLPDGCLIHLGRKDFQVQIRGYRVEVAEIEVILLKHAKVKEVAVKGIDDLLGEKRLVAYVVSKQGENITSKELQNYLKQYLPDYMIPSLFMMMSKLPLTDNGKVDRLQLPLPEWKTISKSENHLSPRTEIEKTLAKIWSEVLNLNLNQIGINDDFFLLGGDSLKVIKVVSRIRSILNMELPLRSLFEYSTIAQCSKQIERMVWFNQQTTESIESNTDENWEEIEI